MEGYSRLFFALWPDDAVRDKAIELAQRFHEAHGGHQTARESLHITLAFLGATPDVQLASLEAIAGGLATPSFQLSLTHAGSWSGGIVWLAPLEPPAGLTALVTALHSRLKADGVGFDGKRFVPHITLLRRARVRGSEFAIAPIEWAVQDFVLVRTLPAGKGVAHEVIGRFPLQRNQVPEGAG